MYPEALKDLDFNNKKSRATVAPLALSGDTRPAGGERESKDLEYRRRAVMFSVRYIPNTELELQNNIRVRISSQPLSYQSAGN